MLCVLLVGTGVRDRRRPCEREKVWVTDMRYGAGRGEEGPLQPYRGCTRGQTKVEWTSARLRPGRRPFRPPRSPRARTSTHTHHGDRYVVVIV
eukprot:359776-Chlamydomonas_euryale.AAC.2